MQNAFNPMMGFPSDRAALTGDLVRASAPAASAPEGDHAFSGVFSRLLQNSPDETGKSSVVPADGIPVIGNAPEGVSSDEQALPAVGEMPFTAMPAWGIAPAAALLTDKPVSGATLPTDAASENELENKVLPQTDFPDDSRQIPVDLSTAPDLSPLVSLTRGSLPLAPASDPASLAIPNDTHASSPQEGRPIDMALSDIPAGLSPSEGKANEKKQKPETEMEARLPMSQASLLAAFLPMERSTIPSELNESPAPISGSLPERENLLALSTPLSALPPGFRNAGPLSKTMTNDTPVFSLETSATLAAGQTEMTQESAISPSLTDISGQSFHPLTDGVTETDFGTSQPMQPAAQDSPMQPANFADGLSATLASPVLPNESKPFSSVPALSTGIPLQSLSGLDQSLRALNGRVESVTSAPATGQANSASVSPTGLPVNAAASASAFSGQNSLSFQEIADETVDMLSITESDESPELSASAGSPDLPLPGMMPGSETSQVFSSPGTDAPQTGKPELFTSIAQNPVDQVADGAIHSVKNGHRELVIRLNPDNLGEVRINLVSNARHELSARLIADTPEAHAALADQMDTLRRSLEAQGLQVERLSVMLAGQADNRSDSAQSGPHHGFAQQEHAKGSHQQPSFNPQDSSGSGQPGGNSAWTQQGQGGQPQYNRNAFRNGMQSPVDDRASGASAAQPQRNGGLAERRQDGGRVSILA